HLNTHTHTLSLHDALPISQAKSRALLKWVKGPDFPTGGIVVDSKESIAEAYVTGRGSFRTRAKWVQEEGARGTWIIVVTEIPWLDRKSTRLNSSHRTISYA